MSRNKYIFAQELLKSYKLTSEQKERVIALITRERNEDITCLEEKVASLEKNYVLIEKEEPIEKGKNKMSPKKIESLQEWSQKEVVATELVILNGYMNNPDTNEY